MEISKNDALEYHSGKRKGKIEVVTTKPVATQRDLSLAYSPGVAEPCLEIANDESQVFEYTAKGNLVAVISNGTAVLGLGDIGPSASKPVMEGKGVLFKKFADIDVFDIELNSKNIDDLVMAIKMMEPTFGGINLEDFAGPDCFEIEKRLKAEMNIPVFHDDQHGTAIISGAAMLNAVELAGKKLSEVKAVYNGAGASGIACAKFHISLGLKPENVIMCDSKGVIHSERDDLNEYKVDFARDTELRTLEEAFVGADMFFGLSKGNVVSKEMVRSMAPNPIIFAMANPVSEISYPDAIEAREDVIMATGRSDYPNQVNNVLGFPFIFRGALDVHAKSINEEMKLAAAYSIAQLAKEEVPDAVKHAYGTTNLSYGKEYIIPKPFDPRVLTWVAPAVAKAAMDSGVARKEIKDFDKYKHHLDIRMGRAHSFMNIIYNKAKSKPLRVVFPEGENTKIISAVNISKQQGICEPVLIGNPSKINEIANSVNVDITGIEIIDPRNNPYTNYYSNLYFEKRCRKGITRKQATEQMLNSTNHFGSMLLEAGQADAMVSGLTTNYSDTIKPALEIVGQQSIYSRVSGLYIIISHNEVYFLTDTTVNIDPKASEIADITLQAADFVRQFDIEPRVALLSYSNFGSSTGDVPKKMQDALKIVNQKAPELIVDGDIQADVAVSQEKIDLDYSFSKLSGGNANVLVFPNLTAGNVAYKLLNKLGNLNVIGPVLQGMSKSIHVLQKGSSINEIVDMTAIANVMAQNLEEERLICSVKY